MTEFSGSFPPDASSPPPPALPSPPEAQTAQPPAPPTPPPSPPSPPSAPAQTVQPPSPPPAPPGQAIGRDVSQPEAQPFGGNTAFPTVPKAAGPDADAGPPPEPPAEPGPTLGELAARVDELDGRLNALIASLDASGIHRPIR